MSTSPSLLLGHQYMESNALRCATSNRFPFSYLLSRQRVESLPKCLRAFDKNCQPLAIATEAIS